MNTPEAKFKLGTERFYSTYSSKAFRYAELVQQEFLPRPEHPLVTATNRHSFSTVEYDNYLLDQALKMGAHHKVYMSVCGTYLTNTSAYECMIDPENPIINKTPTTSAGFLAPYRNGGYRAFLAEDGQIYKATSKGVKIVIVPWHEDIDYLIYGMWGFFCRQNSFLTDPIFQDACRACVTYAYLTPGTENPVIHPVFARIPLPDSVKPAIVVENQHKSLAFSRELYEIVKDTRYGTPDAIYTTALWGMSPTGDAPYKQIVLVSSNKHTFEFTQNSTAFTSNMYISPSRMTPRFIATIVKENSASADNDTFAGAPVDISGVKISDSTDIGREVFTPLGVELHGLWTETE